MVCDGKNASSASSKESHIFNKQQKRLAIPPRPKVRALPQHRLTRVIIRWLDSFLVRDHRRLHHLKKYCRLSYRLHVLAKHVQIAG